MRHNGKIKKFITNLFWRVWITFVTHAKEKSKKGSPEQKRSIFLALGSNRTIIDKKLSIDVEKTLLPMKKVSSEVKAIHEKVRTAKEPINTSGLDKIYSQSNALLPR